MHYLTVQDMLWINLQVTKKVHPFDYATLEEATFYQYAYGDSKSLVPQAARFLDGFQKKAPFPDGNAASAFVGFVAFLAINGADLHLGDEDAAAWVRSTPSADAVAEKVHLHEDDGHDAHKPDVRAAVKAVLARFPRSVSALSGEPVGA